MKTTSMKALQINWPALLTGIGTAAITTGAFAQGMFAGGAPPSDPGRGLAGILGQKYAFSATARTVTKESPRSKPQTFEYAYANLDGKSRVEMDMTKSAGGDDAEAMKTMGMDRMVILQIPGKASCYLMYPGLKAYCEIPAQETTASDEKAKVERTEAGNETLDGHPCVKWKVTTTKEGGATSESLVWEATDLNNFPIQCEVPTEKGGTSTTRFKDIKTDKPAASLFELPADFKKYGSIQEMMMSAMQKMMPQ
jgi:hypothetical protein